MTSAKEGAAIQPAEDLAPGRNAGVIRDWLVARLADELGVEPGQIDSAESFDRHGLDSAAAVTLIADLEDWLGAALPANLPYVYDTVDALAAHLAERRSP